MDRIIEVAVGVIVVEAPKAREAGEADSHNDSHKEAPRAVLLASRPAGKVCAGFWEFPGGKLEPGETPAQACARELFEELGIERCTPEPWFVMEHVYPHGHVRVHFLRIRDVDCVSAPVVAREGQEVALVSLSDLRSMRKLLPMVEIVVHRAELPDVLVLATDESQACMRALPFDVDKARALLGRSLRAAVYGESGFALDCAKALDLPLLHERAAMIARAEDASHRLAQDVVFGLAGPETAEAITMPRLPYYVVLEAREAPRGRAFVEKLKDVCSRGAQGIALRC